MKKDLLALTVGALGASAFWVGASCRATAPAQVSTIVRPPPPPAIEPLAQPSPPEAPPSTYLEVAPGALDPFYASLDHAEEKDAGARTDLLFFGDSHTAGDQLTGYLRHELQEKYGDAGRGFVLAGHPPIRYYTQRDITCASTGRWSAELGGKRHATEPFGMAGVRAHSDDKSAVAWVEPCATCQVDRFDIYYLKTAASGALGWRIDDGAWQSLPTQMSAPVVATAGSGAGTPGLPPGGMEAATFPIPVPVGHHKISMRPSGGGPVELFGVAMEKSDPGVIVDSLGVVGRRLSHLYHWDWTVIGPQLTARDPALVVLQYGTNEADDPDLELDTLAKQYDEVIARVRQYAPRASILILGPPDMGRREAGKSCDHMPAQPPLADGTPAPTPVECQWLTPPVLAQIVDVQRQAARRNGVAFFDSFGAMGGADLMDGFFHQEPALAYSDRVHFTDRGYERWGQLLLNELLAGYADWKERNPAARSR
ncbi:MAG TPA: GDSL-type esterase/lipase family protein [Kofleriaceae bacterium]|jgi:lysophospholipase L1-like esterase|nr:GDSL-type esterase/lipase family protein [Kofleriaceae bacterium]